MANDYWLYTVNRSLVGSDYQASIVKTNAVTGVSSGTLWTSPLYPGIDVSRVVESPSTGYLSFAYADTTSSTATICTMTPDGTIVSSFSGLTLDWLRLTYPTFSVDSSGRFYTCTADDTVTQWDTDGTFLQSWTIGSVVSAIKDFIVSSDGSTLYYIDYDDGVWAYDLVNSVDLDPLYIAPSPANVYALGWDTGQLGVWIAAITATYQLITVSLSGTTLNTSNLTSLDWPPAGVRGDQFWLNTTPDTFNRYLFSDPTAIPIVTNADLYLGTVTGPDTPVNPDSPTAEGDIRWVRRCPHIINELKRTFYRRFELAMDVGQGGADYDDPAIYMRYSNDGGKTWTAPQLARYGVTGQWNTRVFWAPLGSGRDRVFEVYGDAPAPLRLVDAYL